MVVPLRSPERFADVKVPERLMPMLQIDGAAYLMETPKLAAVPQRLLQQPAASLAHEQERILAALDFLFQGYGIAP